MIIKPPKSSRLVQIVRAVQSLRSVQTFEKKI
jgi:hypothetical protein